MLDIWSWWLDDDCLIFLLWKGFGTRCTTCLNGIPSRLPLLINEVRVEDVEAKLEVQDASSHGVRLHHYTMLKRCWQRFPKFLLVPGSTNSEFSIIWSAIWGQKFWHLNHPCGSGLEGAVSDVQRVILFGSLSWFMNVYGGKWWPVQEAKLKKSNSKKGRTDDETILS